MVACSAASAERESREALYPVPCTLDTCRAERESRESREAVCTSARWPSVELERSIVVSIAVSFITIEFAWGAALATWAAPTVHVLGGSMLCARRSAPPPPSPPGTRLAIARVRSTRAEVVFVDEGRGSSADGSMPAASSRAARRAAGASSLPRALSAESMDSARCSDEAD